MADEPTPILGYTTVDEAKRAHVNESKQMEERILRLIDVFVSYPQYDGRWLAIGRTCLQQGFMAINRAIMQPQRISLPEDQLPGRTDGTAV